MTMRRVRAIIGVSSIALALTSLSVVYERATGEPASAAACQPPRSEACEERRRAAGFPLAFLYDRSLTSEPGTGDAQRGEFRPLPFMLNVIIYLGILLLALRIAELRRGRPAFEPPERRPLAENETYESEMSPREG